MEELKDRLRGIETQLAVNNHILDEHHQRSLRLEKMVELVEKRNYQITTRLYLLIGAISVVQAIVFVLLKSS